ncbi:TetR family transcriptional regulator C-terminal domain-containing protein [Streptomyces sp. NPDC002788]
MADRIDAMPVRYADPRAHLCAVAEQALPLDAERHLESVVWSSFLLTTRTDPDLLREHSVSRASRVRRLTVLVHAALPGERNRGKSAGTAPDAGHHQDGRPSVAGILDSRQGARQVSGPQRRASRRSAASSATAGISMNA